eukprot:jgi/Astpho2/2529/Aster-x0541
MTSPSRQSRASNLRSTAGSTQPERSLSPLQRRSAEAGFLEIYPRNSTNAPRLLTQLNELLASKQREAEKAACSLGPSQRCQAAAANLQLEVHRQLFDAFIAGFASYSPLLLQIKDAYEERLDASLQCGQDNMHLRAELAAAAATKAGAVKAAGREAAAEIATSRMQLQRRLVEELEKASKAELRAGKLAMQAKQSTANVTVAQAEQAQLQELLAQLTAGKEAGAAQLAKLESWGQIMVGVGGRPAAAADTGRPSAGAGSGDSDAAAQHSQSSGSQAVIGASGNRTLVPVS